jgi:uncharacterized RDD family membrane protein YckC
MDVETTPYPTLWATHILQPLAGRAQSVLLQRANPSSGYAAPGRSTADDRVGVVPETLQAGVSRGFQPRYARVVITPTQYSPDGRWWWNGTAWLPAPPPQIGSLPPVPWTAVPAVKYAGFWLRLLAYLIDAVLLNLIAVPLNLVVFGNSGVLCSASNYTVLSGSPTTHGINYSCNATGAGYLIYFLLGLVYFTFTWSRGATLGQRALKIRIADAATNRPLSLSKSLVRYVGFWFSLIPLAIGLIWAGVDPRKRGWHDKMANSVALRSQG